MRKNHSSKCFRIQKPHFSFLLFSGFPNQNIPEDHNSNPNKLLVTCTVTLKKKKNPKPKYNSSLKTLRKKNVQGQNDHFMTDCKVMCLITR